MIIFYHGPDVYRLRAAVAELWERARTDHGAAASAPRNMTSDEDRQELERTLKYPSFFGQTEFVVARGVLADAATAKAFQELLERYDVPGLATVIVVACHEGVSGRASAAATALTAYLKKHATSHIQFMPLTGDQHASWIREFCADRECTIDPGAMALLERRSGADSWALANDLEKLCACGHDTSRITTDMVGLLTTVPQERDEFALSNALAIRDKRAALAALWTCLHEGMPGQMLLGALAHSIRTLLSVGDLARRRVPPETIARTVGLPPFVVAKTLRGLGSYPEGSVERAHATIARLDRDSKNGITDLEDGLYGIILDL